MTNKQPGIQKFWNLCGYYHNNDNSGFCIIIMQHSIRKHAHGSWHSCSYTDDKETNNPHSCSHSTYKQLLFISGNPIPLNKLLSKLNVHIVTYMYIQESHQHTYKYMYVHVKLYMYVFASADLYIDLIVGYQSFLLSYSTCIVGLYVPHKEYSVYIPHKPNEISHLCTLSFML